MKKRWWGVIAAGVLVAGAYGYLKLTAVDATGLPVSVIPVVKGSIENKVMASGMVKAKQEVTLFSPNNGTLLQFNVQEGDKVTANQVIARIDVTDLSSEMASIDAQIASQHAELNRVKSGKEPETIAQQEERVRQEKEKVDSAEKEYNRTKQLVEAGASPATDLDKAKDSLSQAQSSLKMSQSELALNKKGPKSTDIASVQAQINQLQVKKAELAKQSSQSTVVAPFSGTVLKVDAKNGQAVTKGTEIITMGDLTKLQVVADINESDVKELQLGQKALVSGTSMGKEKV
ncbi:HlyD family secretion protein, partial [Brevibacillus laterosporus]